MRRLWIEQSSADRQAWTQLLYKEGIRPAKNISEVYGIEEGDRLIATGSIDQNILKCIAVDSDWQGGALFNELISGLLNLLYSRGYDSIFVYTKPKAVAGFGHLGFQEIERVEDKLVFMEKSGHGFPAFLQDLKDRAQTVPAGKQGAIVMNANPMTRGHLYLVNQALAHCDQLFLFVVSDDSSLVPAALRWQIVSEAVAEEVADRERITLLSTSSYLVSSQTFPSYFLREDEDVTRVQATLDAQIFKNHIAPALGVSIRFVGDEPFSPTTRTYNEVMAEVFAKDQPTPPVDLQVIHRKEADGQPISASRVRQELEAGNWETIRQLVPPASFRQLKAWWKSEGKN